jgi:hypothetical protein
MYAPILTWLYAPIIAYWNKVMIVSAVGQLARVCLLWTVNFCSIFVSDGILLGCLALLH